jgi:chromosome segregation ATPase
VHYVKGTEKMLKKMKEELSKYKTVNAQLQTELDESKGLASEPANWESERETLQHSINEIKTQMTSQISALEMNLDSVQKELVHVRQERDRQLSEHERMQRSTKRAEEELEDLKSENSMLEKRAAEAEQRVTMLLDQVGTSVTNYRRQSQIPAGAANGISHNRELSASTVTDTSSLGDDDNPNERGSMALENLASELETLKSQWQSTSRNNYRLSNQFDFEKTPTKETAGQESEGGLMASMDWRRRLEQEEKGGHAGSSKTEGTPAAAHE